MPVRRGLATALIVFALAGCTGDEVPTPVQPLHTPQGPSQTEAEAERDGVPKSVAALTLDERTRLDELPAAYGPSSVTTNEGVWRLSRPGVMPEYGEVLLLDARRERILKAFPLDWPPYFLATSEDAIYCGRAGDGALPDTTLCRIDRDSHKLITRTFDDLELYAFVVNDDGIWTRSFDETWTQLDLDALEILERGSEGPASPD